MLPPPSRAVHAFGFLGRTLPRRLARHVTRRLPRPSLAGFVGPCASPEHARHPCLAFAHAHCVRVQVHQLSHASSRRCCRSGLRSRGFALRPSYTMRCFAQWLRHCSLARDRSARTVSPGSLAAKPALCKMAAALRESPRGCARVGVRRFGYVPAARLCVRGRRMLAVVGAG